MTTHTPHAARIIRASFDVAEGHTYRCHEKYIARNVADAAHSDTGEIVNVYLDALGFFVTAHDVTRTDVALVYTAGAA